MNKLYMEFFVMYKLSINKVDIRKYITDEV
jgi:hypothetical protein